MGKLNLYRLHDGEEDYVVAAANPKEALEDGRRFHQVADLDPTVEVTVTEIPGTQKITVGFPDDPPEPDDIPEGAEVDGDAVTATASQWAAHCAPGSLVACTLT